MSEPDIYGELRQISHEHIYQIWQIAKLGGLLEGEDVQRAQAMRDHPEFYDVWDRANEFGEEQMTVNGVNPFLHALMHVIIENQSAQDDPPEVRAVLEYKTSHRTPRHEAVHEIASAFTEFLWQVLHDHKPFDNDAYRRKLSQMLPRSRRRRR